MSKCIWAIIKGHVYSVYHSGSPGACCVVQHTAVGCNSNINAGILMACLFRKIQARTNSFLTTQVPAWTGRLFQAALCQDSVSFLKMRIAFWMSAGQWDLMVCSKFHWRILWINLSTDSPSSLVTPICLLENLIFLVHLWISPWHYLKPTNSLF